MIGTRQVHTCIIVIALCAASLGVAPRVASAARYRVGVTTLTFTKTSVTKGTPRPLATLVWYPAAAHSGTAEAHGFRDAAARRGRFPLVIFSHGSCGSPDEATYLTMALASRGFVVAAPPHPGNTAADWPTCLIAGFFDSLPNRVPDVRFVLDSMLAEAESPTSRFAGRLESGAVGMSGLSYGGFTTLLTSQQEPRIKAALSLVPGGTAALRAGNIAIPTMVIGSERDEVVGYAESESAYARLAGPRFLIGLLGGTHLSVVDNCVSPSTGLDFCGDVPQDDAHRLVLHYALPFVRRYVARARAGGRVLVREIEGVQLTAEPHGPAAAAD
jgi:predicted dienelactone hydrolase